MPKKSKKTNKKDKANEKTSVTPVEENKSGHVIPVVNTPTPSSNEINFDQLENDPVFQRQIDNMIANFISRGRMKFGGHKGCNCHGGSNC